MSHKTTRQWLETLPEPYQSQAIANAIKQRGEDYLDSYESESFHMCLMGSFQWGATPEDHEYWSEVCSNKPVKETSHEQ